MITWRAVGTGRRRARARLGRPVALLLAWLAAVVTAVTLVAAMPASAGDASTAPGMIGHGAGSGTGDRGGDGPSGTWISLIPPTSSAIAPTATAADPSSVWISLIPPTSSAVGGSAIGGSNRTSAAPRSTESAVSSSESAARSNDAAGETSASPSVGPGALRRDPVPGAAELAGASTPSVSVAQTGSAVRWIAIAAGAALVLLGASVLLLRTRRPGRR